MPPRKRTRGENQFNSSIFVSPQAAERYKEYIQKRVAIPERGLNIPGPINDEIEKRNWENFCAHPDPAILPLVMEFYANARDDGVTDTVFFRGKQICFSSAALNHFYDLTEPDASHEFHDFLENHVDWTDVISALCKEETVWKYNSSSGDVSVFPTKQLAAYPRAWFYFVSASLMPASHLSSVYRNRAAVIFAIINDIPVNVGKILYDSILSCIKDDSLALVCPSLITNLCKAAGVHWSPTEPLLPAKSCFDSKAFYATKDSHSGFGTNNEYAQPPPPPRRQNMGQKLDTLDQQFNTHIAALNTNLLNHQHRLEELFEYQRQSNEVLHQALIHLAQQTGVDPLTLPTLPAFPQHDNSPDASSD